MRNEYEKERFDQISNRVANSEARLKKGEKSQILDDFVFLIKYVEKLRAELNSKSEYILN
jgi:hypothetical protein